MRLKEHWPEIVLIFGVVLAALISARIVLAQERTIITTALSSDNYSTGTYQDDVPMPKPIGVNMMRNVLDRTQLTSSSQIVNVETYYSMDGGKTYQLWSGFVTAGGIVKNKAGETVSASWQLSATPPEGALMLNKTTVSGAPANIGRTLQMWEVK